MGLARSAVGTTRVKAPRNERRRHEKYEIWPLDLGEGCKLSKWVRAKPRMKNYSGEFRRGLFGFLKFNTWIGHVTADALQKLKVMRSTTSKVGNIIASPRIIEHEHVHNVYDTLWATLGNAVGFAVCSQGNSCWCLLTWIQSLRMIVVN